MDLSNDTLSFIGVSVLSLLNFALLLWQTLKRVPREVEKMKAEKIESYSEAAESNMQGAKINNEMLMQRINELKRDLGRAVKHIGKLEAQMRDAGLKPASFSLLDSDPKIETVK